MKKLLVVVLSLVLVIGLASITLAETTVSGYYRSHFDLNADQTYSRVYLTVDGKVSDDISVNANFLVQAEYYYDAVEDEEGTALAVFGDDYSASLKLGNGTLQIGSWWMSLGNTNVMDIMATGVLNYLQQTPLQMVYTADFAEGVTGTVGYIRGNNLNTPRYDQFFLGAAYSTETINAGLNYITDNSDDTDPAYVVNGAYNFTEDAQVLLNYTNFGGDDAAFTTVGGSYTMGQLYAALEYTVSAPDAFDDANPIGWNVKYNFNDNVSLGYLREVNAIDGDDENWLRFEVSF